MRGPAAPLPAQPHDLAALAAVVSTSGTTAQPREVPLTYGNFLWSAIGSAVALGIAPGERWLCTLPLVHVGGLSIVLRSAIYGTTAVVHERFVADQAVEALMDVFAAHGYQRVKPPLLEFEDSLLAGSGAAVNFGGGPSAWLRRHS